jgi:hypothetical protein
MIYTPPAVNYRGLMLLSLEILSSMGGWVLKRFISDPPVSGLTINMWVVDGFAFIGIAREAFASFSRALARP